MVFERFEELVRHAQVNGATHMTMSNYHEGGFWKYGKLVPKGLTALEIDVLSAVLGDGWQDKPVVHELAHFNDGPKCNYRLWDVTEFFPVGGEEINSQFVPIEQAVDWYRAWNKYYD